MGGPRAYQYFGSFALVALGSLPRAIKMPSKRLSQPSSSHLQLLNGLPLDFASILHRFIDHFGTSWDPKSCRKSDHDYVTFCDWFVALFCAFACIINSCKPAKNVIKHMVFTRLRLRYLSVRQEVTGNRNQENLIKKHLLFGSKIQ